MAFLLVKYGVQTTFTFAMVKRGVVDLAATGDWTPATGDTKISKDAGNFANTTNNPVAVGGTGSVGWKLILEPAELQAGVVDVQIVDSATKAVEDQYFKIYTYGNASGKIIVDLSDIVRMGMTALPNAAAEAAGGLYTRGTGAGQINQPANGQIDVALKAILGTALTETSAGYLAASFKKVHDVVTPVFTSACVNQTGDTYNDVKDGGRTDLLIDGIETHVHTTDGHITADYGSTEKTAVDLLDDAYTGTLHAAIADAVWEEAKAGHVTDTTFGDLATDLDSTLADTGEIQAELADGGRTDLLIDGIKTKTDSLTFTVAGMVDSNVVDWKGAAAAAMTGDAYAEAVAMHVHVDDLHDTDVPAINTDTDLLIEHMKGKQEIVSNQLILYKSDNTTEICRFNTYDAAGDPAITGIAKRTYVTP